jgi:hypothetical protein
MVQSFPGLAKIDYPVPATYPRPSARSAFFMDDYAVTFGLGNGNVARFTAPILHHFTRQVPDMFV